MSLRGRRRGIGLNIRGGAWWSLIIIDLSGEGAGLVPVRLDGLGVDWVDGRSELCRCLILIDYRGVVDFNDVLDLQAQFYSQILYILPYSTPLSYLCVSRDCSSVV